MAEDQSPPTLRLVGRLPNPKLLVDFAHGRDSGSFTRIGPGGGPDTSSSSGEQLAAKPGDRFGSNESPHWSKWPSRSDAAKAGLGPQGRGHYRLVCPTTGYSRARGIGKSKGAGSP